MTAGGPTWDHFTSLFRLQVFGTYDLDLQVTLLLVQRQLNLAEATGAESLSPDHLARSEIFDEVPQLPGFACHAQTRRPTAVFKITYLAGELFATSYDAIAKSMRDDTTEKRNFVGESEKRRRGEEE